MAQPGDIYCQEKDLETIMENGDPDEISKVMDDLESRLDMETTLAGIAEHRLKIGALCMRVSQYGKAIDHFEKCLEISNKINDPLVIAKSNIGLGRAYIEMGNFRKAITYFNEGLRIYTAIKNTAGKANSHGNLGEAYCRLGQYREAIKCYKTGLEINSSIGDESGTAENYDNLGTVYRCLGEYEEAKTNFRLALMIDEKIKNEQGQARSYGNLGIVYLCLKDYEKAEEHHKKALDINIARGNKSEIVANKSNLGNTYLSLGQYEKAIKNFKECLEMSTAIQNRSAVANVHVNISRAYLRLNEFQKAIDHCKTGLKIGTDLEEKVTIATSKGNLGNIYRCSGEYDEALLHLEESIHLFDTMFLDAVPDRSKLSFAKEYFDFHTVSMQCFLSLQKPGAALLVMDRGRAKELHFCLEKQSEAFKEGMLQNTNSIWGRIEAKQAEEKAFKEFEIFLQNETSCTVSTTILFFAFDMENILNIWILKKEITHRKLDVRFYTLFHLINQFLSNCKVSISRDSSFFEHIMPLQVNAGLQVPRSPDAENSSPSLSDQNILQQLFQHLISPVKDLIDGNRLIIVPDGPLFFLPFSSLIDEHGCYLSERYSILITPSLHSLKASMEKPHCPSLGFALFVGNPTSDLPMAAEEVKCLANLFEAIPILEHRARKQVLLKLLDKASIIHIAAHGKPNSGEIMLASSHSQGSSTSISSLLTQQDVTNIFMKARLVVLSCCHTGQGKVTSEGVIGITRAFLAAGARSVLATLWPINDSATKKFMEKFYEELCQETSVCEALRRTKNFFQEHERQHCRSVEVWSPFTIYGEDVKFDKQELEKIKEESRCFFSRFDNSS